MPHMMLHILIDEKTIRQAIVKSNDALSFCVADGCLRVSLVVEDGHIEVHLLLLFFFRHQLQDLLLLEKVDGFSEGVDILNFLESCVAISLQV